MLSIMGLAEPLQGLSEPGGVVSTAAAASTQLPDSFLLYGLLFVGAVPLMLIGFVALMKASRLALLVMLCLFVGTLATAILISVVVPGYVKRTLLAAILGWSFLVGAAPFARWVAPPVRLAGRASVVFCLAVSLVVLGITYASADKQHWRDLAADTASAIQGRAIVGSGGLLITYPTVTDTLLDVYQPHVLDAPHIQIEDGSTLPALSSNAELPRDVWFAYIEAPGVDALQNQLQSWGYNRASQKSYPGALHLDSYILP